MSSGSRQRSQSVRSGARHSASLHRFSLKRQPRSSQLPSSRWRSPLRWIFAAHGSPPSSACLSDAALSFHALPASHAPHASQAAVASHRGVAADAGLTAHAALAAQGPSRAAPRYGRPMLISETGTEGAMRASWLEYVVAESERALARGCELPGITLYPIVAHPGWGTKAAARTGSRPFLAAARAGVMRTMTESGPSTTRSPAPSRPARRGCALHVR